MALGISRRAYARLRGVSHRAINYAVSTGVIIPLPDGSIDPEQADRSWGIEHAARISGHGIPDAEWDARIGAELAQVQRRIDAGGETGADIDIDALIERILADNPI